MWGYDKKYPLSMDTKNKISMIRNFCIKMRAESFMIYYAFSSCLHGLLWMSPSPAEWEKLHKGCCYRLDCKKKRY